MAPRKKINILENVVIENVTIENVSFKEIEPVEPVVEKKARNPRKKPVKPVIAEKEVRQRYRREGALKNYCQQCGCGLNVWKRNIENDTQFDFIIN